MPSHIDDLDSWFRTIGTKLNDVEYEAGIKLIAAIRESATTVKSGPGLEQRYRIERIDGKPLGPALVMQFDDQNCWEALLTYATTVKRDYPKLSEDVRAEVVKARIRKLAEYMDVDYDTALKAFNLGARPILLGDAW
ncbi:MAG TPA: hypothetical protein VHK27_13755 [Gammaproteobacteria bacterium]|nr:hypothetical protein [Gammaproteobacteria bacterium]